MQIELINYVKVWKLKPKMIQSKVVKAEQAVQIFESTR